MLAYILRRIIWSIPVVLLLTFTVFALMRAIPGGPFDLNEKGIPEAVRKNLESRYHLEWSLGLQFSSYIFGDDVTTMLCSGLSFVPGCDVVLSSTTKGVSQGLIRGDLGVSFKSRRTVNEMVAESFPVSFQLGIIAIAVALTLGIPAGTLAALRQNSWVDYTSSFFAILGLSIPGIVMGPLLIWVFPLTLNILPVAGWGSKPPFLLGIFPTSIGPEFWSYTILPALTLGTSFSATIARLTRASLLQVVREDYIRTARAKGLAEQIIVVRHALKNSLIPVITVLGPLVVGVVTGTFVVEQIFGIPGMGKHFVTSIGNRDYTVITSITLIYAALLVVGNLTVDIMYGWLDPRIRYN